MSSIPQSVRIATMLFLLLPSGSLSSGENAPIVPPAPAKPEETNSQEILRSYVQLQEQVHATQLAIEHSRREAGEAAARNTEILTARLKEIEAALSAQRARELEAMQSSNRGMLFMAGTFAFVGLAAMLVMAFFQWRTVHGLATITAGLPSLREFGGGSSIAALEAGDMPAVQGRMEQSQARLAGALELLEKRIYQLEHATRPALPEGVPAKPGTASHPGNGNGEGAAPAPGTGDHSVPVIDEAARIKQILAAGQALLDEEQPERALASFESALSLNPRHGEALVKKGTALERLQRLDEAIACYDQALVADGSLTIAYLHKGGLFNRMEKFTEALECYEKALRTQEKRA